jgi:hypothetical protein
MEARNAPSSTLMSRTQLEEEAPLLLIRVDR